MSAASAAVSDGPDFGMTDLEEALRGPDGPSVHEDSIKRLGRMSASLAAELDGGALPNRYDRLRAMQLAVATASRIFLAKPPTT